MSYESFIANCRLFDIYIPQDPNDESNANDAGIYIDKLIIDKQRYLDLCTENCTEFHSCKICIYSTLDRKRNGALGGICMDGYLMVKMLEKDLEYHTQFVKEFEDNPALRCALEIMAKYQNLFFLAGSYSIESQLIECHERVGRIKKAIVKILEYMMMDFSG